MTAPSESIFAYAIWAVKCSDLPIDDSRNLVKMRNGVSYLVYMYTLGAGRILIKNIIIVCLLNLMAWKASCAHRTGEIEKG